MCEGPQDTTGLHCSGGGWGGGRAWSAGSSGLLPSAAVTQPPKPGAGRASR